MTTVPTISTIGMEELLESLTGYEEQEIENRFGVAPDALMATKPMMGARALIAVAAHRIFATDGIKDAKGRAYKHAMDMKLSEVMAFFPDEEPEVDPEQPVTQAGEGDSSAGA